MLRPKSLIARHTPNKKTHLKLFPIHKMRFFILNFYFFKGFDLAVFLFVICLVIVEMNITPRARLPASASVFKPNSIAPETFPLIVSYIV